jgi:predicted lactoylglutathione lyase
VREEISRGRKDEYINHSFNESIIQSITQSNNETVNSLDFLDIARMSQILRLPTGHTTNSTRICTCASATTRGGSWTFLTRSRRGGGQIPKGAIEYVMLYQRGSWGVMRYVKGRDMV